MIWIFSFNTFNLIHLKAQESFFLFFTFLGVSNQRLLFPIYVCILGCLPLLHKSVRFSVAQHKICFECGLRQSVFFAEFCDVEIDGQGQIFLKRLYDLSISFV